jgi:hypothetical protein
MTSPTPAPTAGKPPGPNDVLPCPTPSSIRRHLARGEACDVCHVEGAVRRRHP